MPRTLRCVESPCRLMDSPAAAVLGDRGGSGTLSGESDSFLAAGSDFGDTGMLRVESCLRSPFVGVWDDCDRGTPVSSIGTRRGKECIEEERGSPGFGERRRTGDPEVAEDLSLIHI